MPIIQDPNRDYHPPLTRPEKNEARAKLAADLEAFIARGGHVDAVPPGATANPMLANPIKWNPADNTLSGGAKDTSPARIR
jgi:hypothetical protein